MLVGLAGGLWAFPALAHKTEISGNVAGIWHLEPNHSPKAGEPSQVWIALTQQGGKTIPLEQCDCRLAVFKAGEDADGPVLEPELEPISAESFRGIPGAEVTFPEIGEYQLVLTGRPQREATFTPFELSYTTVVAAGRDRTAAPRSQPEPSDPEVAPGEASFQEESQQIEAEEPLPQSAPADAKILWILGGVAMVGVAFALGALRLRGWHRAEH